MSDSQSAILLNRFQFAHILNKATGTHRLAEGPGRFTLDSNEELVGEVKHKVQLADRQWVRVHNPFDAETQDIRQGESEIRVGPLTFPLRPFELLDGEVQNEFVLTVDDALLLRAEKEAPNPLKPEETIQAGTKVLLKGPARYIPHKDITVKERRQSLSLSEDEGVYVQNDDTGKVRLVEGPVDFFVAHNESLWDKKLTDEEEQALGYADQKLDVNSRVLAATPRERGKTSDAIVIELEDNEAICVYEGDKRRVEFGPKKVFLGPHERPKVLFISGGVPVRPNVLRIAKLGLGPDFIRDKLVVRTKDNALLTLEVSYRWQFRLNEEQPEKLFALKDFVGYAAQTLSSEIREAAAGHDFEAFHSGAAGIVKRTVFGEGTERVFEQNGLAILGIDVEGVTPQDKEIAAKLTDTIKTTVDIVTRRQQEEAQLESERRLIEGKARNEAERGKLVELEIANKRKLTVETAAIDAEAARIRAQGEADAVTIRATADAQAEGKKRKAIADVEQEALKARAEVFAGEGGIRLIELARAEALKATDKLIVPADTKLFLGLDKVAAV